MPFPSPRPIDAVAALVVSAALVIVGCAADPTEEAASEVPTPALAPTEAAPSAAPPGVDTGISVARRIDGDSLELEVDGEVVEVRLLGINAPELADCQGPSARDALMALLDRGGITIDGGETDRFGRELVWLGAAGIDVNREMVRSGWSLANHGDGGHLVDAMRAAAADGVGLWNPSAPGCTPAPGDVRIVDAEPDPDGRDEDNVNGEYVVLGNTDSRPVDLTDWILRDESTGNRFTLPSLVIDPGREVVVRTGCGTDSATEVFWCSEFPVWSNRGDTALLLGPDGSYVHHLFL